MKRQPAKLPADVEADEVWRDADGSPACTTERRRLNSPQA
jgi:hypothetical protein